MTAYYKVLGAAIFIVCVIVAIVFFSQFDLRTISTENDFINAMLHSTSMVAMADRIKLCVTIFMIAAGLGIGSFCFGIGEVLKRVQQKA